MLVPTEDELNLIKEAKAQAPRSPLGPAEQCLLTLENIPHLSARLQLWAFTLDHDNLERVREKREKQFYICLRKTEKCSSVNAFLTQQCLIS